MSACPIDVLSHTELPASANDPLSYVDRSFATANKLFQVPRGEKRGRFLVFDGTDGCGKGTQIKMTSAFLSAIGVDHILTKQPGGSIFGQGIRELMFGNAVGMKNIPFDVLCMLFDANELYNTLAVIEPALKAGRWVLTDRYFMSAIAYRCPSPPEHWIQSYRKAMKRTMHDLWLFLDGDPEVFMTRAHARTGTVTDGTHQQAKIWNALEKQRQIRRAFHEMVPYNTPASVIPADYGDANSVFSRVKAELLLRFPELRIH